MSDSGFPTLHIAPTPAGFLCRVVGRATARESGALHRWALQVLAAGGYELVIDVAACTFLDSTLMGCLADLHKRFARAAGAHFALAAPRRHCRMLFGSTRLDKVLEIVDAPPRATGELVPLTIEVAKPREFGRHVMRCHRRLAEIDGPHQAVFARIAETLTRELNAESSESSPSATSARKPARNPSAAL